MRNASSIAAASLALACAAAQAAPGVRPINALDAIVFGDAASERAHRFEGRDTKAVAGALGEPARVSLPRAPLDHYGDLSFDLQVDLFF